MFSKFSGETKRQTISQQNFYRSWCITLCFYLPCFRRLESRKFGA